MAKKKQDWIDEAAALGIETDELTVNQLKDAIESHEPEMAGGGTSEVDAPVRRVRECDSNPKLKANRKEVV